MQEKQPVEKSKGQSEKSKGQSEKSKKPVAFRNIAEVSADLDVPQHVLRFWETKFSNIRPLKRGGGRRYYRPEDIDLLHQIRELLYAEAYTIKGVQRLIREGRLQPSTQRSGLEPSVDLLSNLLTGSTITNVEALSEKRFSVDLTGSLSLTFELADPPASRLVSRPSNNILLPVPIYVEDENFSTVETVIDRLIALKAAYNILFLLGDDRETEMERILRKHIIEQDNIYLSALDNLLKNKEKLHILSFGSSSFWITVGSQIAKSYRTIWRLAAAIYPEGRKHLLRRVEAETKLREHEARDKELDNLIKELALLEKGRDMYLETRQRVRELDPQDPKRQALEIHLASFLLPNSKEGLRLAYNRLDGLDEKFEK